MLDVTLPQPALHAAIKTASAIADKRNNNAPVLACLRFEADPKTGLEIVGSDMLVTSKELLPVMADGLSIAAKGGLCVNARILQSLVATLPAKPIRLRGQDNHWLEVTQGRAQMRLMGQNVSDFPEIPMIEKGTAMTQVGVAHLTDLIEKTMASISTDEARVNLNGLLLESSGQRMTAVSTDGHRLSKLSADIPGPKLDKGIIIPRRAVVHLKSLLARAKTGELELGASREHLFVRHGGLTLILKLANVVFPPYEMVIPKEVKRTAKVDRVELTMLLKRCMTLAPEKTSTVRLTFQGKPGILDVATDNPDVGTMSDQVDMQWTGEGDIIAGYNAHYLLDALEVITTKEISLSLQGELDPMVVRPVDGPDFLAVVMPMRI